MSLPIVDRSIIELLANEHWARFGPERAPMPKRYLVGVRRFAQSNELWSDVMAYVTPKEFLTSFANTDHSRTEWECEEPLALLNPGCWPFHAGFHATNTPALCQMDLEKARAYGVPGDGRFSVTRVYDNGDRRNYQEAGHYGIDIHHGVISGLSAEGHQTLPPHSASSFLEKVLLDMHSADMPYIWYLLMDNPFECD